MTDLPDLTDLPDSRELPDSPDMLAVVATRDGVYPASGLEAIAECHGRAVVFDIDGLQPAVLATWLVGVVDDIENIAAVVLPGSPDGRDLAPRLAALLQWPLLAGAVSVEPGGATVARRGGLVLEHHAIDTPFVATLQPGVRGIPADLQTPAIGVPGSPGSPNRPSSPGSPGPDPVVVSVSTPDASELDLVEASRILAVGAGLKHEGFVELAGRVAAELGMSLGATRVITDWGWLPFERQIGTTGAMINPDVYVALGISGAVQHISGLGEPDHIVSVNTDGNCPMAAMAETNLVCDAQRMLIALADRLQLEVDPGLRELVLETNQESTPGATGDAGQDD